MLLIFSLLSLSIPAAPRWAVVRAEETATDIRYALAANGLGKTLKWANSILGFYTGGRRTPKITSIQIQPADPTIMQGERVNFAAIADSIEGTVHAVEYRWTVSPAGERQSQRAFHNGIFSMTRPGKYVITASGNGVQGQTTVTVLPNEGFGLQKKLRLNESEWSDRDRQVFRQLTERGIVSSRNISSREVYSSESERRRGLADQQWQETIRQKQNEARQRNPDPLRQSLSQPANDPDDETTPEEETVAQAGPRKGGPRVDEEAASESATAPSTAPAARLLDVLGWDNGNWYTADDPGNQVGNPPGSAPDGGASNGNFRLTAPVLSLAGRGLDLNLALNYNSRLWSKSGTTMTYDADDGFPAPGWNIGFGKMVYTGANGGCMLIAADGTRRSYAGTNSTYGSGTYYSNNFVGYATDGSFADYTCYYSNSTYGTYLAGTATLANGTTIVYSSPNADYKQIYPTQITDAHGNYITITYVNNRGPRINTITDTLGRAVTFNYDSSNRLINVTGPGYNNTTRTFARITYAQKTLSYAFASGYTASSPSNSPHLIESIYYPETNTGYWFGDTDSYSSYGMIAKVQSQRGMGWSGSSGTQGTTTEGTVNREEVYNFPMTANSTLTDAPGYTTYTESWDRMDTSAVVTSYSVSSVSGSEVIEVTRPDGSRSRQTSVLNPSSWDDGLYFQNEILEPSPSTKTLSKTKIYLASGAYGSSRPTKIEATDELEQMTKTEFTYGTNYNQVTVQKEFDYSGSLYREIRYTYENSAAYTSRHIFSLVKKVEQYDALNNRLSLTEYEYDNNAAHSGTPALVAAPNVVMHHESFDPHTTETQQVQGACLIWYPENAGCTMENDWVWVEDYGSGGYWAICTCSEYEYFDVSVFDSSTYFRGNVTKITTYSDADSTPSGAVSHDFEYDIAGNQRTATTNCCEQMSFNYTANTQYSQPESTTKGSPDPMSPHRITTSATYDFNTSVTKTSTNANGRTTTVSYDAVSRPTLVTAPTGAKTTNDYGDSNFISTQTSQLADNTVVSKTQSTMNGRGQPVVSGYFVDTTNQNKTSIEYDVMGRRKKVSNPYASSGSPAYWTQYTYDYLSRVTEVKAPDNSTSKTFYNENPLTTPRPSSALAPYQNYPGQTIKSQDAWGRERWARTDAFGRLVEVVEPGASSNGTVTASGNEVTHYSYNASDELVLITQGSQTRSFKYDSLGRLTGQKLAEQTATINDVGIYVGPGGTGATWSDVFVYDVRSNLTQRTDARGVKTNFSYSISTASDPLNRLHGITYDKSGAATTPTIHDAPTVSIEYMATGDKTRVWKVITNGVATEENTFDTEGRVSDYSLLFANRTGHEMKTSYQYDTASRLTQIRYPKQYGMTGNPQKEVNPTYDYASRLSALNVDSSPQMQGISYNEMGQVTQLQTGPSGHVYETYGYDPQTGLLTSQYNIGFGLFPMTLMHLEYEYNRGNSKGSLNGKTGQLTRVVDNTDHNKDRVYEHDALGRLSKAKGGLATGITGVTANWTQDYSYDRYGNKTGTTKTGVDKYNAAIQLDGLPSVSYNSASNRMSGTGWEYDSAGNLTKGQNADGVWRNFEYDAAGRLVKVRDASSTLLETYTYGASRNRLKVENTTQRTYFAWGGNSPIVEYTEATSSSTPVYSKAYVYAGSRLVSTARNYGGATESTTFHHPDRLGTGLITEDGYGYERNSTLPFGTAMPSETSGQTNQPFTSYDRSASTGLDYAVNRLYSQGQSRFTQVDPIGMDAVAIGNPQSNNLYSYVQNMPADFVDPTGENMAFLDCGFRTVTQVICVGDDCSFVDIQILFVCTLSSGGGGSGGGGGGGPILVNPRPSPRRTPASGPLDDGNGPTLCNLGRHLQKMAKLDRKHCMNSIDAAADSRDNEIRNEFLESSLPDPDDWVETGIEGYFAYKHTKRGAPRKQGKVRAGGTTIGKVGGKTMALKATVAWATGTGKAFSNYVGRSNGKSECAQRFDPYSPEIQRLLASCGR